MNLHIMDLKQYMYTGVSKPQTVARGVIEDASDFRAREFRCGSLSYLIDEMYKILVDTNNLLCFCIDTTPTFKRELSESKLNRKYKDGRAKSPVHVNYQFEFAKRMVKIIGFNCIELEGYEADDGVSSLVKKYHNQFDKITIYSNDSDQYYLVDDKVTIVPTSLRGKIVNMSNYEKIVNKDMYIEYNTLTVHKLIHGESGDNIPAIPRDVAKRLLRVLPKAGNPFYGDNTVLRTIVKNSCKNDEKVMAVFDLLAPVVITDARVSIDFTKQINVGLLRFFGIEFQSYCYRNHNYSHNEVGEEMIEDFLDELEDKEVI